MERLYFDHNATTPVAAEVVEAMLPCFSQAYGNASSIHFFGQQAKLLLERARRQTASLLGCRPAEIVFTSGGTEANNLAILGVVRNSSRTRRHVITTAIEHPCVLDACRQLEREGVEVTRVRVGSDGVVSPDDIRAALKPHTVLVSVMHANNEIGTVQPIQEISAAAHSAGVLMHSDGVQSAGKIPVDVRELGVDFYAFSGHKIYGPKGAGALYVRKTARLQSILFGGHQERGRRPGTENVAGAVGLGAAAELARRELLADAARLERLRDRLERAVLERIPFTGVNGAKARRVPNTTNIYFDCLEGEAMVIALDLKGMAVSTGSACSSGSVEPSHVLSAIGLDAARARASIRFSLGRQNTDEQVDALVEAVEAAAAHLRKLSPAYPAA
ncbi:MAG TPA: cysteine desulfurase family protein [Bryobacterales bacterium]|nr:cysteine desulfurase family protein [Bryobacterales bacterium]